jgi:glutamyl-tRNA reductase
MRRLLLLGLNHTSAPLEVREKIAFNSAQQRAALDQFRAAFPESEIVLLSTCNRVELYTARATHGHPRAEEMSDFLAGFHNVPIAQLRPHLYHKAERDVVDHLFAVASSLDSMVLGETQILGQVREAYDAAHEAAATGPLLNPLFQRALAVGKQVMHETALGEGRLSVASVAVDYAKQIFDHFNDKTVLSIGAGKMATLALRHFSALNPKRLLICNREPAKGKLLAEQFNGQDVPFENLPDHLIAADVVITSTGSREPIILKKQFEGLLKKRRYRPLFMIDIALPRDIEKGIGELENVYLYNLDDLQQVVSATQSQRKDSLDAARKIVAQHVEEFTVAHRARELGPVIEKLQHRYHAMAREELQRTLSKFPNLSDSEKSHLEDLTRRIVNKLLHAPIQAMRKSDSHAADGPYLHAMEKLFRLEEDDSSRSGGE